MEVDEQIRIFREFIEEDYYALLLESVRKGKEFIVLDFQKLVKFNPEISDELLEDPENLLKAAEIAIRDFDLPKPIKKFNVRFTNLPESQRILVSEIRSKHLQKFIWSEGIVRQKSSVRPHVTSAKFECPSCGNILNVLQLNKDKKYKEPTRCGCGRKGKFKEISKELVDGQGLVLEESPDDLDGAQPKRINVFLKDDLVSPITERRSSPGSKVRVYGWVVEVPETMRSGGQSTKYDLILEANYLDPLNEEIEDLKISEEEMEQIRDIAKDPHVLQRLASNLAPSIYGHDKIKEALVLQLAGGCKKKRSDGVVTRGDTHILLIGDPGSGKSQLLKRLERIAPKARFTSGKGASAAGLCVAPDSLVHTNPGLPKIKSFVEEQLKENQEKHLEGIWKNKEKKEKKYVFTLDNNYKFKKREVENFWKLKSPKEMVKITTSFGKEITLTKNTKLLSINKEGVIWKESKKLKEGDFLATNRNSTIKDSKEILTISLIKSNPTIYGIKKDVKKIIEELNKKFGSKRNLAKKLEIKESNIYHNWVKEEAKGNISFNNLKKLLKHSKIKLEEIAKNITGLSLYKGHKIKIPLFLNEDLLYFAGLIVGDGDLSKHDNTISIRFSNNQKELLNKFRYLSKKLFNVNCNTSSIKTDKRPESISFSSKIVFEILEKLGLCHSPKSNKINLSKEFLSLDNKLIANYIKGLFDCNGSVIKHKNGSSYVDLTTTSKKLAKKLQLVLLRYGIIAKLRERPPCITKLKNDNTINGKLTKFIIEIKSKKNLELFEKNIGFIHSEKRRKLNKIIKNINKYDTNTDIIPFIHNKIKLLKEKSNLTYKELFSHNISSSSNISRRYLKQILNNTLKTHSPEYLDLYKIANSDILWDKITEIKTIKPNYKYVYDLTVNNTHNFLVNGILVHNTASVVKDEFLGGWSLEAGTLVLANQGFAIIDEMDKMTKEDRSALHEALEQQSVSVSKANIQATLRCETTVIAAANPKFGRFDPYDLVANQINLPPTLINRFDLIFPVKDLPSKEKDERTAAFILSLHKNPDKAKSDIPSDLFKKYFSYIRKKVNPQMTDEAIEEIKAYYITMRNSGGDENGIKSIPITARQLEALVRLSEAHAKVRMGKHVTKRDTQKAIELIDHCLNEIAKDKDTGKIDIDRIGSRMTATQRGSISLMKDIIQTLEKQSGEKIIPIEEIIDAAGQKNISKDQAEETLEKLRRSGDIFEPKRGFIQKL